VLVNNEIVEIGLDGAGGPDDFVFPIFLTMLKVHAARADAHTGPDQHVAIADQSGLNNARQVVFRLPAVLPENVAGQWPKSDQTILPVAASRQLSRPFPPRA